jgi:anti-anti-sigma regulatory factor
MESGGIKKIRVDCGSVRVADLSGLQLLDVWMRCARIRGVEPELVNLPDSLRQSMQRMGYRYCFTETNTHQ